MGTQEGSGHDSKRNVGDYQRTVRRARIYERSSGTVPGSRVSIYPRRRATLFTRRNRVCMGSAVGSHLGGLERAPCITLQSAKLCARELFTTAEIAVPTHTVSTPPEHSALGCKMRKEIFVRRIRDSPLDTGWRKNGLRAMIDRVSANRII